MSEHLRHNGYQWCDTDRYVVLDRFTGLERQAAIGFVFTKQQALDYVASLHGWEDRKIIARLEAIVAFKLAEDLK